MPQRDLPDPDHLFPHRRTHPTAPTEPTNQPSPRPPTRPSSRLRARPPRGGREARSPVVFASKPRKTPRGRKNHLLHAAAQARTHPWRLTQPFASILSIPPADATTPTPQLHPPPASATSPHRAPPPPSPPSPPRAWAAAISPRLQPPARLASFSSSPFPQPVLPRPAAARGSPIEAACRPG
jgi:hypothetical protein